MERCAGEIEQQVGSVNILAGIIQVPLPPEKLSMKTWDEVVRVDQRGTYVASVAARRRGSIINSAYCRCRALLSS